MRQRPALPDDLQILCDVAGVGDQDGHGLGGVEGSASAEPNHRVANLRPSQRRAAAHGFHVRLGGHRKADHLHISRCQEVQQRLGPLRGAAGHYQRPPTHAGHDLPGLAEGPGPEDDPPRGGELEAQRAGRGRCHLGRRLGRCPSRCSLRPHYQPPAAGNTFENFTLDRGSAIMGATVSRQIW